MCHEQDSVMSEVSLPYSSMCPNETSAIYPNVPSVVKPALITSVTIHVNPQVQAKKHRKLPLP